VRELGVAAPLARVLAARGFVSPGEARAWLHPDPASLHDPFGMGGMDAAVARLVDACRRGARVVVFGDYDCDGIGALAILTTTLKRLGADAIPFLPHRLRDGYGLRSESLRRVLDEHAPEGSSRSIAASRRSGRSGRRWSAARSSSSRTTTCRRRSFRLVQSS
jgi:Single-stranded DNA-specific exonuclease